MARCWLLSDFRDLSSFEQRARRLLPTPGGPAGSQRHPHNHGARMLRPIAAARAAFALVSFAVRAEGAPKPAAAEAPKAEAKKEEKTAEKKDHKKAEKTEKKAEKTEAPAAEKK